MTLGPQETHCRRNSGMWASSLRPNGCRRRGLVVTVERGDRSTWTCGVMWCGPGGAPTRRAGSIPARTSGAGTSITHTKDAPETSKWRGPHDHGPQHGAVVSCCAREANGKASPNPEWVWPMTRPEWRAKGKQDPRFARATRPANPGRHEPRSARAGERMDARP